MDERLSKLIDDLNKKIDEAQNTKWDLVSYLEDKYNLDYSEFCEFLEKYAPWVCGVDAARLEELLK